ncbi:MAG: hypothetical protein Q7J27_13915 [Syntrophales bacterium]|nr:hypothetical protein [Syntrophales bacterium]
MVTLWLVRIDSRINADCEWRERTYISRLPQYHLLELPRLNTLQYDLPDLLGKLRCPSEFNGVNPRGMAFGFHRAPHGGIFDRRGRRRFSQIKSHAKSQRR